MDTTGVFGVGENSALGCYRKRVLWVSIAKGLPRNMRWSISRGHLPPLLCTCFPFLFTQTLYLFTLSLFPCL